MNTTNFKPGCELSFDSVVKEHGKLLKTLTTSRHSVFCLDLSEVLHCDSAGLAFLIEAKTLCQQHHKTFEVKGISSKALALAEFCGVQSILETA